MITNTGKSIMAKYLIGQTPAYASYVAVGCGANPINNSLTPGAVDFSNKTNLDMEMFRVPIVSRGYVTENGISKVVLTAELPSEERYEITEVGIYSAASDPALGLYDSKTLYSFSIEDGWLYHQHGVSPNTIQQRYGPLDGDNNDNNIYDDADISKGLLPKVFYTNADNRVFGDTDRIARYERSRFLNNIIMISGDTSEINSTSSPWQPTTASDHIHVTGQNIDLSKNSPEDELRLAFSIVNKELDFGNPDAVKILVQFASSESENAAYCNFEFMLEDGVDGVDFSSNRYSLATTQLKNLVTSPDFTWNSVDVVRIYASVINNGEPTQDFYVALDAIRLENVSSTNPLYGLVGYSAIRTSDGQTVVKLANTSNFIEFRFAMAVQ